MTIRSRIGILVILRMIANCMLSLALMGSCLDAQQPNPSQDTVPGSWCRVLSPIGFALNSPDGLWGGSCCVHTDVDSVKGRRMVDWIANSIDGKQSKSGTLYLEPEVQRVVGLNGAGLVFLTKRNGSEVLQVFDVLATPPLVRDVMDFGEHEKVLAIRYQATEGVLYWLDGNGGVLRRIPVQTPVPLVLADQDAKISVLVPEAPRRITAARISSWSGGFWPDRGFELADGGYLDLAKDIGQRDWGSWRFRHHGGHLTLVPIEESEMAFPEMECWQIAPGNPGSFGVQVSGLVAGALRINAVARNGEDLEVSYADRKSVV